MNKARAIRVSAEFDDLVKKVKKQYGSANLSDPQATAIITRQYWDLKLSSKHTKDNGGLL